jgi:predicted RNA-binding Zn-ribbon protein involved in translation (DUF1610 family)
MEEKKTVNKEDLAAVAGGINTIFYGNEPMCPVCGERPIKLVSGDEFTDTYQCPHCGSKSTHTKKLRPIPHPGLTCPRCGSIGKWRIVESANGTDTVECTVCRLSTKVPAEQN